MKLGCRKGFRNGGNGRITLKREMDGKLSNMLNKPLNRVSRTTVWILNSQCTFRVDRCGRWLRNCPHMEIENISEVRKFIHKLFVIYFRIKILLIFPSIHCFQ